LALAPSKTCDEAHRWPVRILYLINSVAVGGAEQIVLSLARGVDRSRFQPSVCLLWRGESVKGPSLLRTLREEHIDTHVIRMRTNLDLTCVPRLIHRMRKDEIGIVHTFLLIAQLYGRIAAKLAGTPVIVSSEQETDFYKALQPIRSVEVQLSKMTDAIVTCSDGVRSFLCKQVGVRGDNMVTVYNSLRLENFSLSHDALVAKRELGLDSTGMIVGMVAHLRPEKGHILFLRAAAQVLGAVPGTAFLLVGDGPLRDDLERLALGLGISDAVHFLGSRKDIPRILSAMDVFVLSSLREGFGIAAAEAMAMGKPVVATTVGGIPEVVADGQTGILVPPQSPDALAAAIVKLLRDERLRNRMGEAGRKRAEEHFSSQAMVRRFEEIYEGLWQRKQARRKWLA